MADLYRYTECGLDYVYLRNGFVRHQTGYGEAVEVEGAAALDRQIAHTLIARQGPLTGQDVRFLRGLLDLTQAELADLLGKDAQSIARWEKQHTHIPPTEDRALRQITLEEIGNAPRFIDTARHVATLRQRLERLVFEEDREGKWRAEAA